MAGAEGWDGNAIDEQAAEDAGPRSSQIKPLNQNMRNCFNLIPLAAGWCSLRGEGGEGQQGGASSISGEK